MFGASLIDLSFLTTAELTALRLQVATEISEKGGTYLASATSGDVSTTKQYGVSLENIMRSIAYEMQKRGLATARITRTGVRFS